MGQQFPAQPTGKEDLLLVFGAEQSAIAAITPVNKSLFGA